MNDVDSDHGDRPAMLSVLLFFVETRRPVGDIFISPVYSHLVERVTVRTSFGLFILEYFIRLFTLLLIREQLFVKGVCCLLIASVDFTWEKNIPFVKKIGKR